MNGSSNNISRIVRRTVYHYSAYRAFKNAYKPRRYRKVVKVDLATYGSFTDCPVVEVAVLIVPTPQRQAENDVRQMTPFSITQKRDAGWTTA